MIISLWNACNLRCKFCYNDYGRDHKQEYFSFENIRSQIDLAQDYVCIVWWEPLFHPNIFEILDYVLFKKIKIVWIVTNWIRFSDNDFLEKFIKYKVDVIQFSIHSDNPQIDELISSRKWAFINREKGIINYMKLIKNNNLKIEIYSNTVPNKYNIDRLDYVIKYINSFWIKNIVISGIYNIKWFTDTNRSILCKYSEIVEKINLLKDFIVENRINLEVHWIPLCIHKNILIWRYKIRELWKKEIRKILHSKETSWLAQYNKDYKILISKCKTCSAYWKFCLWVFKDYVEQFGEEEFMSLNNSEILWLIEDNRSITKSYQ